ncbi:hypothetical protein HOLleu_06831 [Holothuria leucospilota]|uniref:MYND-type domain-containing protein n=1 Tax=Holothuria leucospilota TaxID=206669 RepID=A0A9Q1CLU4_HOLLE|nr:hypothetical protein HOLleu_06831 [Holothuria leucospilota]
MTPFNYFLMPVRDKVKSSSADAEDDEGADSSTNSGRDWRRSSTTNQPTTDTSSFSVSPDVDPQTSKLPCHEETPGASESSEKMVATLSYGDTETHAYTIWRHLRTSPNSDEQLQVDNMLDGLDILGARDKPAYCRLVQRLAERILPYCLDCIREYHKPRLKQDGASSNSHVPLDQKSYNVIRLIWIMCLYTPALNRITNSVYELYPSLTYLLHKCHRRLRRMTAGTCDSSTSGGESRDTSSGSATEMTLTEENLTGFMLSILSILYNTLYSSKSYETTAIMYEAGLLKIVAVILRKTRNVTTGEICLRIMDISADYGGVAIQTVLRDLQVMRDASNLWHYMLKKNMVSKTGFQIAELISRLGETLRQGARGYAGGSGLGLSQSKCGCKEPSMRRQPLFRIQSLTNANHWCSSPLCGDSENVAGRKFRLCAKCRLCMYCSEGCQEFHWNQWHRSECTPWTYVGSTSSESAETPDENHNSPSIADSVFM